MSPTCLHCASVLVVLCFIDFAYSLPSNLNYQSSSTLREKRDTGNIGFGLNNGFALPGFSDLFQRKTGLSGTNDQIGVGTSGNVDTVNPSVSLQRGLTGLGLIDANEGISQVGARGNGNFGAGFGKNVGIVGNKLVFGDNTDANFNKQDGFDLQNKRGVKGILTEDTDFNLNPQAGGRFGLQKKTCLLEALIKGLCFQQGGGIDIPGRITP